MPATLTHLSDVWRNYSDDGDTISKLSSTLYFGCSSRDQLVQSCQPNGAEDVIGHKWTTEHIDDGRKDPGPRNTSSVHGETNNRGGGSVHVEEEAEEELTSGDIFLKLCTQDCRKMTALDKVSLWLGSSSTSVNDANTTPKSKNSCICLKNDYRAKSPVFAQTSSHESFVGGGSPSEGDICRCSDADDGRAGSSTFIDRLKKFSIMISSTSRDRKGSDDSSFGSEVDGGLHWCKCRNRRSGSSISSFARKTNTTERRKNNILRLFGLSKK